METAFGLILLVIPFYPVARLYLQVWLVLPQTRGATFVYSRHVEPFLRAHEHEIDNFVDNAHKDAWSYLVNTQTFVIDLVRRKIFGGGPEPRKPGFVAQESGPDVLSESYVESLLNQFREPDAGAVSFFRSLMSTIPKGRIALRGDFGGQENIKTPVPSPRSKASVHSTPITKDEETFDVVNMEDGSLFSGTDGLLSSLGWVKVNKEKVE